MASSSTTILVDEDEYYDQRAKVARLEQDVEWLHAQLAERCEEVRKWCDAHTEAAERVWELEDQLKAERGNSTEAAPVPATTADQADADVEAPTPELTEQVPQVGAAPESHTPADEPQVPGDDQPTEPHFFEQFPDSDFDQFPDNDNDDAKAVAQAAAAELAQQDEEPSTPPRDATTTDEPQPDAGTTPDTAAAGPEAGPSTNVVYLETPYDEREAAKELGAQWDNEKRTWYVEAHVDLAPFRRWLPAGRIYLNCPFKDKGEAKELGARWDSERKKWFVREGMNLEPFAKWM